MQKLVLLSLFLLAAPVAQAEMVWSGSAGLRHVLRYLNDGLETKTDMGPGAGFKDQSKLTNKRWEYRASIGVSEKGESVDWGMDLRTQPAASTTSGPTTEWVSNTGNQDLTIRLSQAYGRYRWNTWETDMAATFGRAKTVLLYDNLSQQLFDNDVRWDGLGWTFKQGNFGLNAVQYVLGATSQGASGQTSAMNGGGASAYSYSEYSQAGAETQSHFAILYAFQPYLQVKLADDITSIFAIGYLTWTGTQVNSTSGFYNNGVHGGSGNSTANTAVGDVSPVVMDNAIQWQFFSDTSLPHNLRFVAEYIRNKKTFYGLRTAPTSGNNLVEANRAAWALSLFWGKPKKAGEYGLGYTYGDKGIASVVNTFTNGDVAADTRSHFFDAKYMVADNFAVQLKAQFHKEKAHLGGDGQPLASPNEKRNQTQERYEFVTTIQI
jgi:hypothetical protein